MKADVTNYTARARGVREEPAFAFGGRWTTIALAAIIVVAVFTHFFNLVGFPPMGSEEGNLVNQAIRTRETGSLYPQGTPYYGQPFLGWAVLAGLFAMAGFPPATVGNDLGSIYSFYFVPRAITASLAVVDTLLLYFVGRRLLRGEGYGLVAAAVFAVAPASVWYFRVPLLQTLMVPFLLVSLYLALGARDRARSFWALPSGLAFGAMVLTWFPAILFMPAFLPVFLLPLLRDQPAGVRFRSLLLWLVPALAVILAWVAYAASNDLLGYLAQGVGWAPGSVPGLGMDALLGLLFGIDPLLLVMGLLGIGVAVARRRWVAAALPLLGLMTLATLTVRWDYHLAVLVPLLALPAGLLVADLVGLLVGLLGRFRTTARLRSMPLAPTIAVVIVLALILPAAGLGMSRDQNWAPLSATSYVIRDAPPFSAAITSGPYVPALDRARPDLWVVNYWDPGFQVLQNASTNPLARQQTVFLKDILGNLKYNGPVVGTVQLQLPVGDYVALGQRSNISSGQVAFHLDRNVGILFLAYGLDPVVLWDRSAPPQGVLLTVTLLDPVVMPKYLLLDDQVRADALHLPFLQHLAGNDGAVLYAANNEESIHTLTLPAGVYSVRVLNGNTFLGSALVKLDGDQSIVFNVDSPAASAQGFEVNGPLDPAQRHTLNIMVQHSNGLPLSWAWVEVQQVNALAYYQNGVSSAEVRLGQAG